MKITLIKPNIGRREHSLYVDNASMEPLQLGVLAALTPEDIDVVMYDDRLEAIPYDDTVISKDVVIEDNVWLGNRVIVLPGVTIGEGAIIQAGSVVVKDIPKCAIAGGHPANVFSSRDKDHYEKLKKEGKFH